MRHEHTCITYQYPTWVNNTLGSHVAKPCLEKQNNNNNKIHVVASTGFLKMSKLACGITIKQIAYGKQYQIYNFTLVLSFTSWLSIWYY